jgi:hypothetical protein
MILCNVNALQVLFGASGGDPLVVLRFGIYSPPREDEVRIRFN